MDIKFGSDRAKKFVLDTIDFRVPRYNDLYIDKLGKVNRCKIRTNFSRYAKLRVIVRENWLNENGKYKEEWDKDMYMSSLPIQKMVE